MQRFRDFLKRKDIEISLRRYGIDALGAMAQGLFCSLLIGTILNTLGQQFHIGFLNTIIFTLGKGDAAVGYTIGGCASLMAGLYIIIGIIGGLVAGYKPNEIAAMFTKYGKEMFTAALVLGMAKAVSLVLTQGNIIDTMVYGMSSILGGLPAGLSAVIMFLIQTIVNFFINSGSGQAAAMMPIMAPLSDLIGVSRQTAILAFQMGDGLSNMIWPTSASMMAYVFAANEKFESYLKFVLPIFLVP